MFDDLEKNFSQLEKGKKYDFTCKLTLEGIPCMKSINGRIPMGLSTRVAPERKKHQIDGEELCEIRKGDFINEYERSEHGLHLRIFQICAINNDEVTALGVDDEFFFAI